jgi:polyhydroxybutyrate depolymerase
MRNTHCCLAVLIAIGVPTSLRAAEGARLRIDVDGTQREALVFAPTEKPKSGGSPLVFVFHGHGGSSQSISRTMHMQDIWPDAIVVYPQGLNTPTRVDPEGKKPGWQRSSGDQKDRDLKFVDAMLASIRKIHEVDDKRIYVTGFSNGGVFTYVLWSERPNVFAAVAPCAGLPLPGVHVKVPKPAFIVAGEADPLVKIENQRAMIEEVRKLNGATSAGKQIDVATLYQSEHGTPVETLVHSGGHVLPKEAPKLIVDFFRAHELKK